MDSLIRNGKKTLPGSFFLFPFGIWHIHATFANIYLYNLKQP